MTGRPHVCDAHCTCPVHGTPLIYWPAEDDHACQDVACEYGHGGAPVAEWVLRDLLREWRARG